MNLPNILSLPLCETIPISNERINEIESDVIEIIIHHAQLIDNLGFLINVPGAIKAVFVKYSKTTAAQLMTASLMMQKLINHLDASATSVDSKEEAEKIINKLRQARIAKMN